MWRIVTDDNVSLLQWSDLIAKDAGNLKDDMPPHEVIFKDDDNLKADTDLVQAPTNDINYGFDDSCKEGSNDVTQQNELLCHLTIILLQEQVILSCFTVRK
jgi:hypothetical protein